MSDSRPKADKPKRKAPATAFRPGKSGNPGGRKPKTEEERTLEAMCREKTPQALATVLQIMEDGQQERARLAAAQYVIDRGWGKAKESVELTGSLEVISKEQRDAAVSAALRADS